MKELELLKRRSFRERQARKEAERILEQKSLELYEANLQLKKFNEELEKTVEDRSAELVRSERKYRQMINNMRIGMLETDMQGNIQKVNDVYCDLTGYESHELLGKNAFDFYDKSEVIRIAEDLTSGKIHVDEMHITRKDGSKFWALVSGAAVSGKDEKNDLTGRVALFFDITKQKELEHELIDAKDSAIEAQKAEKVFLANMSHEIRTPLNAIVGMSHLMSSTNLDEEQQEYLSIILNGANLLQSLLSDILDISKIDAGKIDVLPEFFDLSQLLQTIKETFVFKAREKDLSIVMELDHQVNRLIKQDPILLNQVLMNLMSNAEKFTEKGEIKLKVELLELHEGKQKLNFKVTDTGIGMSETQLKRIFNRFQQADKFISRDFGGSGLGLFISKRILELLNSEIKVESTAGIGSTFSFELDFEFGDEIFKNKLSSTSLHILNDDFSGKKVLIAEDNKMNRKYISSLFKKWAIDFEFAYNGQEAYDACSINEYDLILMDLQMPVMGGIEATELILKETINAKTPIIALTASTFLSMKNKALASGMVDFVSKPFSPAQLKKIIRHYLLEPQDEKPQTVSKSTGFTYLKELDQSFLLEAYGDDLESSYDMFEIFLETAPPYIDKLRKTVHKLDKEEIYQLLHKIHPSLKMVGLSTLSDEARVIHDTIQELSDKQLKLELEQLIQSFDKQIPLIHQQLEKLRAYVSEDHYH